MDKYINLKIKKNYQNQNKNQNNYILTGMIIGATQTIIGHPIDTLKTL